jgi:diadenosine tetraphosphate (Ap4A) HIT family hydrolase
MVCQAPLKFGHLLVLPKRHVTDAAELSPEESSDLLALVSEMKRLIRAKVDEEVIIHMNTGSHSSQPHIHFHVLPTKSNLRSHVSLDENIPRANAVSNETLAEIKIKLLE